MQIYQQQQQKQQQQLQQQQEQLIKQEKQRQEYEVKQRQFIEEQLQKQQQLQQKQQQQHQYNLEKQYKIVDQLVENKQLKSSYDYSTNSDYGYSKAASAKTMANNSRNSQNRVKFNDIIQVFEHKGNEEIFSGVPVTPSYQTSSFSDKTYENKVVNQAPPVKTIQITGYLNISQYLINF